MRRAASSALLMALVLAGCATQQQPAPQPEAAAERQAMPRHRNNGEVPQPAHEPGVLPAVRERLRQIEDRLRDVRDTLDRQP